MDRLRSWGTERETASKMWEEARMATLYVDLQGDLTFVGDLEAEGQERPRSRRSATRRCCRRPSRPSSTTYFAKPARDPLSAVAAGMRVRITESRGRPG